MTLQLSTLARVLNATLIGDDVLVSEGAIDSRTASAGQLFFAIPGKKVDPHQWVPQVKAAAAVVERAMPCALPQLVVANSYVALGQCAKYVRDLSPIRLIAVTGSNGKTTVKNMIAEILKADTGDVTHVLSTQGNLNSGFGLPLTLLRLKPTHRVGVLEMGMNSFGEIDYITRLARPTVALINNVFPCHVEGLGSLDGIARAKAEIFHGLTPEGIAVLNADDAYAEYWREYLKQTPRIEFAYEKSGDVFASNVRMQDGKPIFCLHTPGGAAEVRLQLMGLHNVRNALAAAAAAFAFGVSLESIVSGLELTPAEDGRFKSYDLGNNVTVIDDAYNANPASMKAAIDVLSKLPGKKILIAADMKELGAESARYHEECGAYAKASGIERFYGYGEGMQAAVSAFGAGGEGVVHREDLLQIFKTLPPDTTLLFKGSNSMRLRDIIAIILDTQSKKEDGRTVGRS